MQHATRSPNPRTRIERDAIRNARELRRAIGSDIHRRRDDAGVTLSWLAREAGISKSHLFEIEAGETAASVEMLARISAALGGRLSLRIEHGTGPVVRDHLQAAMVQAVLVVLHARWRRFLEVAVRRPITGVIDLVLMDPDEPAVVASEVQSEMRRIEQQLRWSKAKADALGSGGSPELAGLIGKVLAVGDEMQRGVSRLLLLRSTRATRAVAAIFDGLLAAAYPATHADAYAALTGTRDWPGAAILWMDVRGGAAVLRSTPPRGIRLGR